jgi:hypothetical protein
MPTKTESKFEHRASNLVDQAVHTFGDALKAGVRIQEEVGRVWTDVFDQTGPVQDWQKKSRAAFADAIPTVQKNAEEWLKLVESNYRRSLGLLKKAFDTDADSDTDAADLRVKTQKLWEESLELIRDNAQAMADANRKVMELWAGYLRKNVDGAKAAAK